MTVAMVDFAFHSGFESPKLSQLVDAAATMLIRRQYASADFMDSAAFSLLQVSAAKDSQRRRISTWIAMGHADSEIRHSSWSNISLLGTVST